MRKLRFLLPVAVASVVAFCLGACGWESSGKDDSWSGTAINVSGTYHGTGGYGSRVVSNIAGKQITYLSVHQNGTAVTITDNAGGQYKGKISSTHKTAKGSASSSLVQYSMNFEVAGNDYQGQYTRLVGTFGAVAEGQLLHDRVISGSWLGTAKNGSIYGLAASITDSQLVNSGVSSSSSDNSSTNNSSTNSSSTNSASTNSISPKILHWTSTNWPDAYHPSVDAVGNMSLTVPTQPGTNWYCRLRIDGGSGEYKWSSKRMAETKPNYWMKPWDSSNKDWMFFPGTKEGQVRITVRDKKTTREIYADITIVDDLANVNE